MKPPNISGDFIKKIIIFLEPSEMHTFTITIRLLDDFFQPFIYFFSCYWTSALFNHLDIMINIFPANPNFHLGELYHNLFTVFSHSGLFSIIFHDDGIQSLLM